MTTTLAPERAPATAEPPRRPLPRVRTSAVSGELALHVVSAAAGSLALTWLVYERMLPVSGRIGFWLCWYVVFLAFTAAVAATTLDRMGVVDRLVGTVVSSCGMVMVVLLGG